MELNSSYVDRITQISNEALKFILLSQYSSMSGGAGTVDSSF